MYKMIAAANLGEQQKFMLPGNPIWFTRGNEPYLWEGWLRVPCTRNVEGRGAKSLLLKLDPSARVKVWSK